MSDTLSGKEALAEIAKGLCAAFLDLGAPNYIEVGMTSNQGDLIVHVQRKDGKTPSELLATAKSLAADMSLAYDHMEEIAMQLEVAFLSCRG